MSPCQGQPHEQCSPCGPDISSTSPSWGLAPPGSSRSCLGTKVGGHGEMAEALSRHLHRSQVDTGKEPPASQRWLSLAVGLLGILSQTE